MIGTQKIRPCLWFDSNAEDAVKHYGAAFGDSTVSFIARYGKEGPGPEGAVMVIEFALAGQQFMAINGGPMFTPNEAVSLVVECADQAEVDRLWDHLGKGGKPSQCGWLKDRYGFSWQIVPHRFAEMMHDHDASRRGRVFAVMLRMTKFDIAALEKAYVGG